MTNKTRSELASDWTNKQLKALLDNIGVAGWSVLQRKTGGRSKAAIYSAIQKHFGGGGITRGTYQLEEAMAETGYSRTQLQRAARALNQRWLRTKKRGAWLITGEQLEDMVDWLRVDYWSKPLELYCCLQCGTTARPHHRAGLCLRCFWRFRRAAAKAGVPGTVPKLQEWVQSMGISTFRTQRIVVNLEAGRAPNLDDLEHLCSLLKQ